MHFIQLCTAILSRYLNLCLYLLLYVIYCFKNFCVTFTLLKDIQKEEIQRHFDRYTVDLYELCLGKFPRITVYINLDPCSFCRDFVQKLATAILSNSSSQLQRIDLSKNSLDDKGTCC